MQKQKLKYVLASSLIAAVIPMASFVSAQSQDYIVPRTPDGQPDLQGLWTNDTITPMERPASLQGRAFLTEDEITAMEENLAERRTFADDNIEVTVGGNVGGYNQVWLDSGDTVLSTGQTSLIVDPPNGRAPLRESAAAIRDYYFAHVEDDYIYSTVWDRCLTRGVPGSMLPAGYNNAYRFIQTADTFTIVHEMIHDVRVIHLNKEEHIDDKVKLYMGDSVARWEGDTLVVETANYNDRGMIASSSAGARLKAVPVTEDLNVVERFTRVSEGTIIWSATITDPEIYTQPFTISMPLTRDDEYVMYEYACHEGNYAIPNILNAGRAKEQQAQL
ncbi:MAG: hypothetical protein CMQ31_02190 [Gammaproteobacteria bacterium]|jgi:hypothetical protein|nr:hypothetical protein [Gammaproteobacteria bacterium]|tara:strand:+ start:135 stop:1130 length:996 start_codon:yes stop_codon:yes gene_type:complete